MNFFKINECYISIGSNKGQSFIYIKNLINMLKKNNYIYCSVYSNFYYTNPIHYKFQNNFINILIKIYNIF